ncbi:hypothetical protein [Streptomyces canus]|uniref:AraC-like ligand-binding domain-containing protein n=1 Tax=Streptomyces canus TaxID=58343 RepID=UPI0033BC0FC5
MVASPLRAAVYRADRAHSLQGWGRPCRTFGLRIERNVLDRQLEVLPGHRVRSPVAFDLPLDLSGGRGCHWWALVQALAGQVHDPDCPPPRPTLAASLEHSIARGLLLAAGHDHRAELEAPVTPARCARRSTTSRAGAPVETRPTARSSTASTQGHRHPRARPLAHLRQRRHPPSPADRYPESSMSVIWDQGSSIRAMRGDRVSMRHRLTCAVTPRVEPRTGAGTGHGR